jgi:hypothetical protein
MGPIEERAMRLKPWQAGLAVILSLAAPSAQAAGCPAQSTRFDDIVVALNKAPNCLRAMQIFEACRYEPSSDLNSDPELCRGATGRVLEACEFVDRRVDQLHAMVKKTCDAEAAKLPPQEECPAKTRAMEDIIVVLNEAPGCDRAMKVFEACEYGASGDVQFGAVVEKKCEADFLTGLKATESGTYQRKMRVCDRKYRNEHGTMYRSFTAYCRAAVAQRYSQKARKAAPASAR